MAENDPNDSPQSPDELPSSRPPEPAQRPPTPDAGGHQSEPVGALEVAGTGTRDQPDVDLSDEDMRFLRPLTAPAFWVLLVCLVSGLFVGQLVDKTWTVQKNTFEVQTDAQGRLAYAPKGKDLVPLPDDIVPIAQTVVTVDKLSAPLGEGETPITSQWVVETRTIDGKEAKVYSRMDGASHFGIWSLLPAGLAIALCLLTKEPLTALLGGVVVGALMMAKFDITDAVLIPSLASKNAATILILYLWLLGGLMGIWSRTGAAKAFAEFMTTHFVRGPRSAKFVAWTLGLVFFQGGTLSTVLVGTTVKPLADKENISHEELSYIVDSTASPIAILLAFNAWPLYVNALIFVPGVAILATEEARSTFFFSNLWLSFYAIFAVLGTFLLSIDKAPFLGRRMREAIRRSRETGELDAPGAAPLSAKELETTHIPPGYRPSVLEFFLPLGALLGIAVGTFIYSGLIAEGSIFKGSPQVNWGFGAALALSAGIAMFKGMSLGNIIEGFGDGLKGVVVASVILMLAITIGGISRDAGGGLYLVDLLGDSMSYWWLLPVCLQLLTMVIAFSTGTSWGTYAVAFPLAMPLAWAVAQGNNLGNPELFLAICFAAVLNGSVYGDQCSPISDTTILSSMTTGCDLMDHVKTQLIPATVAAGLAAVLWTALAFTCA